MQLMTQYQVMLAIIRHYVSIPSHRKNRETLTSLHFIYSIRFTVLEKQSRSGAKNRRSARTQDRFRLPPQKIDPAIHLPEGFSQMTVGQMDTLHDCHTVISTNVVTCNHPFIS